jgi:hypothetical protein
MKTIIAELEKIARLGYSPAYIFGDWIDIMLYAFTGEEENYLATVRKYNNDRPHETRPIDYFTNAFGLLMSEMKKTNNELLGDIYMDWNLGSNCKGQFFTPSHIADLMVMLTGSGKGTVSDPACGAGAMLIARAKKTSSLDLHDSYFVGQDIDLTCVKMTALNMCFFNLNGLAICGNTLTMEIHTVYKTTRTPIGGMVKKLSDYEVSVIQEGNRKIAMGNQNVDFKNIQQDLQMSIF